MIHILIGLICLGLALYFWERFPAFKWIVATVVGAFVILILVLFADANERKKRERLGFDWSGMQVVVVDKPDESRPN